MVHLSRWAESSRIDLDDALISSGSICRLGRLVHSPFGFAVGVAVRCPPRRIDKYLCNWAMGYGLGYNYMSRVFGAHVRTMYRAAGVSTPCAMQECGMQMQKIIADVVSLLQL